MRLNRKTEGLTVRLNTKTEGWRVTNESPMVGCQEKRRGALSNPGVLFLFVAAVYQSLNFAYSLNTGEFDAFKVFKHCSASG